MWFWREEQNSEFPKGFFRGYFFVFAEYPCKRSLKIKTKNVKNYSLILAIVNHRNWLDDTPPLKLDLHSIRFSSAFVHFCTFFLLHEMVCSFSSVFFYVRIHSSSSSSSNSNSLFQSQRSLKSQLNRKQSMLTIASTGNREEATLTRLPHTGQKFSEKIVFVKGYSPILKHRIIVHARNF